MAPSSPAVEAWGKCCRLQLERGLSRQLRCSPYGVKAFRPASFGRDQSPALRTIFGHYRRFSAHWRARASASSWVAATRTTEPAGFVLEPSVTHAIQCGPRASLWTEYVDPAGVISRQKLTEFECFRDDSCNSTNSLCGGPEHPIVLSIWRSHR